MERGVDARISCLRPAHYTLHGSGGEGISDSDHAALKEQVVRVEVMYKIAKHGTERSAFRGEDPHETEHYDEQPHLFLPPGEAAKEFTLRVLGRDIL